TEIIFCVKSVIAFKLDRYVYCFGVVEQYDANVIDHTAVVVNSLENVAGFTSRSQASSWRLSTVKTLKPCLIADDQNVVCLGSTIATPFRPAFVWTARVIIKEELI